jgi:hypothetical protein
LLYRDAKVINDSRITVLENGRVEISSEINKDMADDYGTYGLSLSLWRWAIATRDASFPVREHSLWSTTERDELLKVSESMIPEMPL